ncbi:MAG: universal stress protein [Desulfohalobiaceae bacterium]|nr:universal stress protein [Desulfohalobiaceae bacterium]
MSWLKKKCVVVPIDFSEESFKAVDVAKEFVEEDSSLHLIHVTQPWTEHEIGGTWGEETEEERIQSIKNFLQDKLKDHDYKDAHIAVHLGSPPVVITSYAEETGAELIVMPSHGRTGIKHFALGSVAERVVRKAHCPVLVLKMGEQEKHREKKIISYD